MTSDNNKTPPPPFAISEGDGSTKDSINATHIIAFLKDNPDFFIKHPELYNIIEPLGESGEKNVSNFQMNQIKKLQQTVREHEQNRRKLIAMSSDIIRTHSDIHECLLLCLKVKTMAEFWKVIRLDFAKKLQIDAVNIVIDGQDKIDTNFTYLPKGCINKIFKKTNLVHLYQHLEQHPLIFKDKAEKIQSAALLRVSPASHHKEYIIAYGSRHFERFHPSNGTDILSWMARFITAFIDYLPMPEN